MAEKIESIKGSFIEEAKNLGLPSRGLKTIFVIGSAANTKVFESETYQDFDIHLLFDRLEIEEDTLRLIRLLFKKVAQKHEDENTAIDFVVKDLPWKMIPRKQRNIGIHGTVLNSLDFQRRITKNYILALNMFGTAEILYGNLEFPKRAISSDQFLSEVGGVGWLRELYLRLLPFININDKNLYQMALDVSYYFGLSPLLHFYYLRNRRVAARKDCLQFFIESEDVPMDLKEAARFIKKKEIKDIDSCRRSLRGAFDIIQFVGNQFGERGTKEKLKFKKIVIDEDSKLLSYLLRRPISMYQIHFMLPEGNFEEILSQIKERFYSCSSPTFNEFVESLQILIKDKLNKVDRPYFWIIGRHKRLFNDLDFALNIPTLEFLLYSWEKGITTFIQRLHEIYINKEFLNTSDVLLARILALVAHNNYLRITTNRIPSVKDSVKRFGRKIDKLSPQRQFFIYLQFLYQLAKNIQSVL